MRVELVLRAEIGMLDFPQVFRLGDSFVDLPFWLVGLDGPVPFGEEDHWRVVALIDHPRH